MSAFRITYQHGIFSVCVCVAVLFNDHAIVTQTLSGLRRMVSLGE